MKSEAYPPLTSLLPSLAPPRLSFSFAIWSRVRFPERERTRGTLSLSVEKREDIILLRTRHKVKYRRHKRRTRPWTSLVLRIGTNEEEKKKRKENEREDTEGRKGAPTGYSYSRGADERESDAPEISRSHYAASTPARPRNLLSGCQFEPNLGTSIASINPRALCSSLPPRFFPTNRS